MNRKKRTPRIPAYGFSFGQSVSQQILMSVSQRKLLSRILLIFGVCGCVVAHGWTSVAIGAELKFSSFEESQAEFDRAVVPFLVKHCHGCHNAKKTEGDLDLTSLEPDMKTTTSGARWATLVEKLAKAEMPPKENPQPTAESMAAVIRWAHAEAKRANKHFTRRARYENGNQVSHVLLFDPKNIPAFDSETRVRRVSPEIYESFLKEQAKRPGANQPFTPEGKTTFKDMGMPKIDEPITSTLLQNSLLIVDSQSDFKYEDGKVKGNGPREFHPLFDPNKPPTDAQIEAAVIYQFNAILKRPPTDQEKLRFLELAKKNIADAGHLVGIRYSLAAVLMLPEAVFRLEVGNGKTDENGRVRLSPREIAFAIAYTLTDKRPDPQLLAAAATGKLDTDQGVATEVRRILDDPKAEKPRILRFFREFFGYDKAVDVFKETTSVDVSINHPGHDPRVLVEDTDQLVNFILAADRNVFRELLTTNKSFIAYKVAASLKKQRAEALAKFEQDKAKNPEKFKDKVFKPQGKSIYESYNLTDFPDEQPVELPADQRSGILTQPSWLVANSTTFDNHVIHRGKWIRERLLGGVVPDVPITVDAQLPIAPEKTLRERMKVTQQEYCWKCHQLMNDVALPFEQYDHFGRFRTAEKVLDVEATAKHVDKKGKPLGPVFQDAALRTDGLFAFVADASLAGEVANPIELLKKLAESEYVEQVFVRHAFRYWLGRNETLGDAATLQSAHRAYRENHGSMKSLITSLVTSEAFLYRIHSSTDVSISENNSKVVP